MPKKRQVAVRATIEDITKGTFKREDGPHVLTPQGLVVRRVVLVGLMSERFNPNERYASFVLDDGTGTIRAKLWGEHVKSLQRWEFYNHVRVIGRVREYEGEVYVVPEIVKELDDPNFMALHLYERKRGIMTAKGLLTKSKVKQSPGLAEILELRERVEEEVDYEPDFTRSLDELLLQFVKEHAGTDGVSVLDIAGYFEAHGYTRLEINTVIIALQKKGVIEEIRIGRYVPIESKYFGKEHPIRDQKIQQ